jgi:hypothetical protein
MILRTRRVMASRDHIFRGIDHKFLSTYIAPLDVEDYNRFLHEVSIKQLAYEKEQELKKLPEFFGNSNFSEPEFDNLLKSTKN